MVSLIEVKGSDQIGNRMGWGLTNRSEVLASRSEGVANTSRREKSGQEKQGIAKRAEGGWYLRGRCNFTRNAFGRFSQNLQGCAHTKWVRLKKGF